MEKKKKIIVAGISFIGINISTLLTATVAWFNTNRTVTATGMVVKARNEQNVNVLYKKIYTWDYVHDEPIETNDLDLEPYDCFITTRNKYARKFVKLVLQYPNGVPANTNLSISVDCSGNLTYVKNNETYVATEMSNLIQFKYYDNINNGINETSVATIYDSCVTTFDRINTMSKFVSLSGSGENIVGSKISSIEDHSIPLAVAANASAYTTELFIEYTYNTDLIAYYQANAEATFDLSVFTGSQEINFNADISRIIIDTQTSNS